MSLGAGFVCLTKGRQVKHLANKIIIIYIAPLTFTNWIKNNLQITLWICQKFRLFDFYSSFCHLKSPTVSSHIMNRNLTEPELFSHSDSKEEEEEKNFRRKFQFCILATNSELLRSCQHPASPWETVPIYALFLIHFSPADFSISATIS